MYLIFEYLFCCLQQYRCHLVPRYVRSMSVLFMLVMITSCWIHLLHDGFMIVSWWIHDCYDGSMIASWRIHEHTMTDSWTMHGGFIFTSWLFHDWSWLLHDEFISLWWVQDCFITYLCLLDDGFIIISLKIMIDSWCIYLFHGEFIIVSCFNHDCSMMDPAMTDSRWIHDF
jgi:hypothetical protein